MWSNRSFVGLGCVFVLIDLFLLGVSVFIVATIVKTVFNL